MKLVQQIETYAEIKRADERARLHNGFVLIEVIAEEIKEWSHHIEHLKDPVELDMAKQKRRVLVQTLINKILE